MIFNPREAVDNYITASIAKSKMSFSDMLIKAFFAGMFIAFGAAGSNVAAHAITNVGLSRLTAAVVFPVGLMMVILLGAELFTGDCLVAMACPGKQVSVKDFVRILITVFIGNFIGASCLAFLASVSGQFNYSAGLLGAYTIKVAVAKVNMSFATALVSGILCNVLVAGAVLMAGCAKDVPGKLLVSFFVIMLFVTSGYEHCVANMYYITAGLIAKANPDYVKVAVDGLGLTQSSLDSLNVISFLLKNLVPVTIGNIIGGSGVLGLLIYKVTHTKN